MKLSSLADQAVREYLTFLEDPQSLVDEQQVAELQRQAEAARDPLDRLLALANFRRALQPDGAEYRRAFVDHAKAWAEEHRVPASVFAEVGVPRDALEEAGLLEARRVVHRSSSGERRSVTIGEVQAAVRNIDGEFTAADVVAAAGGGSPMTIRKALNALVASHELVKLGPAEGWRSPGRAPLVYRRP